MDTAPAPGPRRPVDHTPPRAPGSVRRTSSIDSWRGPEEDLLLVAARGRDLRTGPTGDGEVVDEVTVKLSLAGLARELVAIEVAPDRPGIGRLRGAVVARGLGRALAELPPDVVTHGGLLHFILDDLSGAAMVAGYADLRSGRLLQRADPEVMTLHLAGQRDLCAGWAAEGGMMQAAGRDGRVPVPGGPPAPDLEAGGDPLAWHSMDALPPDGMRRRRRLDLVARRFDVHFRDSHTGAEGEQVLHEYTLAGSLDDDGTTIATLDVEARVLPWVECPGAVASAQGVIGRPLDELSALVRRDFRGTSTCTHLNSSLRSLADLAVLRDLVG